MRLKGRFKTKIGSLLILTLLIIGTLSMTTLASNDSYSYSFYISAYHKNGKAATGRYRQTSYVDNQWKVKLTKSGEGSGTITTFWLENASSVNVSPSVKVTQGLGFYYKNAYSKASKTTVWLTAQNNNYNSTSYYVSGSWDEETW